MNEHLKRRISMGVLAWLCALAGARGADVRGYGVFKTQDYLQTSANAPVLQTNWPAYSFSAIVQPAGPFSNQVTSASVESPSVGFVDQLTPPPAGSDQPFASYFGAFSQAVVDANYPTGVYTLRVNTAHDGNKVLLLNLTNSTDAAFPANAPRIANFNEAQAVDPSANFVVNWDAFAGGTTNDFIGLSLADANGVVVFRSATFGVEPGLTLLDGTSTSILIASNKLSWGQTYFGYLIFERDVAVQTNDYAGALGLIGFAKATSFTLNTAALTRPTLEVLGWAGNQFALRLHGDPGRAYVILASTNLAGPYWTALGTNVALGGSFNFTNAETGNLNQRFYRALFKP
jgi:hypothetical protein